MCESLLSRPGIKYTYLIFNLLYFGGLGKLIYFLPPKFILAGS